MACVTSYAPQCLLKGWWHDSDRCITDKYKYSYINGIFPQAFLLNVPQNEIQTLPQYKNRTVCSVNCGTWTSTPKNNAIEVELMVKRKQDQNYIFSIPNKPKCFRSQLSVEHHIALSLKRFFYSRGTILAVQIFKKWAQIKHCISHSSFKQAKGISPHFWKPNQCINFTGH